MARLAGVLALGLAATASAQPITRPSQATCTVRVLEAPDAVRAEIERWVRAEPRCERELDVRVTRVRGGLKLVATSTDGRVRERVIPDAPSAAVLVVSWMADDSIDDALDLAPTPVEIAPAPHVPLPKPPPADDAESPLGPSIHGRTPARLLRHRWLSLGAATGEGGIGAHAQADLLTLDQLSLGLSGGWRERAGGDMRAPTSLGTATAFAAYTRSFGRFDARAQLGIGAAIERRGDRMGPGEANIEPLLEGGLFLRLHLGDDWGVLAGPLVDARGDGRVDVTGFIGLERRL